jgi:hypothetical protein
MVFAIMTPLGVGVNTAKPWSETRVFVFYISRIHGGDRPTTVGRRLQPDGFSEIYLHAFLPGTYKGNALGCLEQESPMERIGRDVQM